MFPPFYFLGNSIFQYCLFITTIFFSSIVVVVLIVVVLFSIFILGDLTKSILFILFLFLWWCRCWRWLCSILLGVDATKNRMIFFLFFFFRMVLRHLVFGSQYFVLRYLKKLYQNKFTGDGI